MSTTEAIRWMRREVRMIENAIRRGDRAAEIISRGRFDLALREYKMARVRTR